MGRVDRRGRAVAVVALSGCLTFLAACGGTDGPESSKAGCAETETFIREQRRLTPPTAGASLDKLREFNEQYADLKAAWLPAVPESIREAWKEYSAVPSSSLDLDAQERADVAYDEVQTWVVDVCRLDGF